MDLVESKNTQNILTVINATNRPSSIPDLNNKSVDPETIANHDTVINAYRCGHLQVVPGKASVWFAGPLVIGPVPISELNNDQITLSASYEKYMGYYVERQSGN